MTEGTGKQSTSDQSVMTEQVTKQAQQVTQQAQQAAQQAVSGAQSALDSQKDRGAQTLTQTADALRKTSQDLQQNNIPMAGQVVDMAAGKLDGAAGYLRSRNVTQLIDDAERYARNNGPVVMGGAFLLGLIAARFLKSSPPSQQGGYGTYGGGTYGGQYGGYQPGSYAGGYNGGAAGTGYASGYQPYAYGETFTDTPGYEGDAYEEVDITTISPSGEGTV
jgi:hypothetical protein